MCGFVGFISNRHFDSLSQDLSAAIDSISHRGPDGTGEYLDYDKFVGMGHRRLSVIDLSDAGSQPMQSDDRQTTITYNGEIYNYIEIRKQLQALGYKFKSFSDTEVVLNAFKEWGADCFRHFIGMFAIAIWDRSTNQIILCRDRIGIKPLYYYFDGVTLIFGSEMKALMSFELFPKKIDEEALPLFLHYQYIPTPRTIFENTKKLNPGTYLKYDGSKVSIERYWDSIESETTSPFHESKGKRQIIDELDNLINEAVSDRLLSDVPLGALLSGGIDSSLVVALMQKNAERPVRTFSIGFGESQYNEAPWARKIADYLGTDHTELYISQAEALHAILELSAIYDEPFADASAIPTLLVSKLTRSYVTVALSGDGGDEQFAGYDRYWMTKTMTECIGRLPEFIRKQLSNLLDRISTQGIERIYSLSKNNLPSRLRVANFADKWQKLVLQLGQDGISEFYRTTISVWDKNELGQLIGRPLPECQYDSLFRVSGYQSTISRLMTVDQNTYLPDCLLTKVDRASMATSLEVRVPLLDHRIVEFTRRLPENLKYRSGTGKYLLKEVLARYIPRKLFERPKMGFGVPIDQWFRKELKELLLDYLSPARLDAEGRFDTSTIERKIKEHLSGTANHHHRLWALLMWQMWRERWI